MILTDSMMLKVREPGMWFRLTSRPMTDISELIYELSVISGTPVNVITSFNRQLQKDIIAKVMNDCIGKASDENEKNWLESEMAEYNAHGLFFYPEEMNDFVEGRSFWTEYVYFRENQWEYIVNYSKEVIIVDDMNILSYYDDNGEVKELLKILQLNHKEAIEFGSSVIVFVHENSFGTEKEFIESHLFV